MDDDDAVERDAVLQMLERFQQHLEDHANQGAVYNLYCSNCHRWVCSRGQAVFLISTRQPLFSTDLVVEEMEAGELYKIDTCDCMIKDIQCHSCDSILGYHVIDACQSCLSGGNNGHYFMMKAEAVYGRKRACDNNVNKLLMWNKLGKMTARDPVFLLDSKDNVLEDCLICSEPNVHPCKIQSCNHSGICYTCAVREIDLRKRCPLCRETASPEDVKFDYGAPQKRVRCKYGCEFVEDEGRWKMVEGKCEEYLKQDEIREHQKTCKYRTPPLEVCQELQQKKEEQEQDEQEEEEEEEEEED